MFKTIFCLTCILSCFIVSQSNGGDMYLDPSVGYIVLGNTAPPQTVLTIKNTGSVGIGETAPTLTTTGGKTDYIGFIYNGVDSKYDCVAQRMNF